MTKSVDVGGAVFDSAKRFSLIAGPCAIESRAHALERAEAIKAIADRVGVSLVYKSSFDKANRTSLSSARGVGMAEGLDILSDVRQTLGLPVTTDVHTEAQCAAAAEAVSLLQIPAFLCRQTDLLVAAAETGCAVNVKKGQFLAPWDMQHVAAKLEAAGASGVILTERGTSFGYNTLVSDMRSLRIMAQGGAPVVFDATHAVQQPGGQGGTSGGQREFVPVLARAAISIGVAGLFVETHRDPDSAPSDGPNMVPLDQLEAMLASLVQLDGIAKANPVSI